MIIRIKLMGVLKAKSPPENRLDMTEGATIADVLNRLTIPLNSVQVFTVNGSLERNQQRRLEEDDEVTVLPPVGGG